MAEDQRRDARLAVERVLPLLQRSADAWKQNAGCGSCHHQGVGMVAVGLAKQRGFTVDAARVANQLAVDFDDDDIFTLRRGTAFINGQFGAAWYLARVASAGGPADALGDEFVHFVAGQQVADGGWYSESHRPPLEDSRFSVTALAVRGLDNYAPAGRRSEMTARIARARAWLERTTPVTSEDRASHLLGLAWAGSDDQHRQAAARAILDAQQSDGGWAQLAGRSSDAYATGQALVALHDGAGLAPTAPAFQRGVAFLLQSQRDDGSWHVPTRRRLPGIPFVDSEFPHGEDQFISYAGTAWAVTALVLAAEPRAELALPRTPEHAPRAATDLVTAALFGTVSDVERLLAAGADPSAPVSGALTPVMAAVQDERKLAVLIATGAKVDARDKDGATALHYAARAGATASVKQLIAAGADLAAIETESGFSAADLAVVAGDLELARSLVAAGAKLMAGKQGIRAAHYAAAVGDAGLLEGVLALDPAALDTAGFDGFTMLHGAAVDGLIDVVRVLLAHRASTSVRVEGFTPLHLAALQAQGHGAIAEMLLAAGADPAARDKDQRTPLDIARAQGNQPVLQVLSRRTK